MPTMRSANPSEATISVLDAKIGMMRSGGAGTVTVRSNASRTVTGSAANAGAASAQLAAMARRHTPCVGMCFLVMPLELHLHADHELAARDRVATGAVLRQLVGAARVLVEGDEDRVLVGVEDVVERGDEFHAFARLDLAAQVPHPERALFVDRDVAHLAGEEDRR